MTKKLKPSRSKRKNFVIFLDVWIKLAQVVYIYREKQKMKPHFIGVVEVRALLRLSVALSGNSQQVRGGGGTLDTL